MIAKPAPTPRGRLLKGDGQPRLVSRDLPRVMDFERYAAFFAETPENQEKVARRVRKDADLNAAKQAEA